MSAQVATVGKITQVIGPVVDVEFPPGGLPEVYTALKVTNPTISRRAGQPHRRGRAAPGREHRALHRHGLHRRPGARQRGEEHRRAHPGAGGQGDPRPHPQRHRRARGRAGPGEGRRSTCPSTARPRRSSSRTCSVQIFETGIKVIDLLGPYTRGGKIGLFGGAGVGKTVLLHGAHPQRRPEKRRLLGVRRRRRAHPRGQRPLPRDAGGRASSTWTTSRRARRVLVYGQMNEPPGARARVALSGAHHRRVLPRRRGPRRAPLRRQHLPLHPGRLRSVRAPRPHPLRRRLPAHAGHRDGRAAGAHHLHQQGLHHLGAGHLRARRRPHRPGAGHRVRPPGRDHGALAAPSPSSASTRPWIRSTPPRRILDPDVVGAEHYAVARKVQGILQRYKELQDIIAILGMDELSEEDKLVGGARPQDPALPVAAVLRGRGVHRQAGQLREARRTPSRASRRSSTASTTTSPRRPSTWWAASTRCWRTPARWRRPRHGCAGWPHADLRRAPRRLVLLLVALPASRRSAASARPRG